MEPTRRLLLAERDRVQARLEELTGELGSIVDSSRDDNADDEHDPEGATIAFERSQVSAVIEQTRRHLAELEAALDRIDQGTYGVCERCGRAIPEERLEVRPVARTCVSC